MSRARQDADRDNWQSRAILGCSIGWETPLATNYLRANFMPDITLERACEMKAEFFAGYPDLARWQGGIAPARGAGLYPDGRRPAMAMEMAGAGPQDVSEDTSMPTPIKWISRRYRNESPRSGLRAPK